MRSFYNTVLITLVTLEEDFCLRENAYLTISHEVNDSIIRKAIRCFQVNIENAVKYIDHMCCCYSRFVDLLKLESISDNDVILMAALETNILH